MNIVYASDENYADILGVSMVSLFENNKGEEINVYILDDGMGGENKAKLLSLAERYEHDISFIDVRHLTESGFDPHHLSMSTFSRLYMGDILEEGIDRALYFDCDIMIRKNIRELYGSNITGLYAGGVGDCISSVHRRVIGLAADSVYINAGVLLADLSLWRQDKLSERFGEYAEQHGGNVSYADQGILNSIMSGRLAELSAKYNAYTAMFDFSYDDLLIFRKPSRFYYRKQVQAAVSDPVIVHYTSSFLSVRPWVRGCTHPFAEEWLKYKEMSPWADIPLREDKRSGLKKGAVWLYRHLPGGLAVRLAGFLHTRVKPFIKK